MDDINRYFEILGLKPGASPEEVKEAYKDLVKVWHPDRFAHDPKLQKKAEEKLKEINEAYQKLQEFLDNLNSYQQATGAKQDESAKSDSKQSSDSSKKEYSGSSQQPPPEPQDTEIFTKANNMSEKQNISDWGLPFVFTVFGFSAGLQTKGGVLFIVLGGVIFYFIGKTIVTIINDLNISRRKKIVWAWLVGIIAYPLAVTIGVAIKEEILQNDKKHRLIV